MTTTEALQESFGTIGREYGYNDVTADFAAIKDFKVNWTRTSTWIKFNVSDYLSDAPREVLDGLARTLYSKICGRQSVPYSQAMAEWVTSDEFIRSKQPIYLRRSRNLRKTPVGKCRDLGDSLQRLKGMGLIPEDSELFLTWTRGNLEYNAGFYSTLMNVVAISSTFDAPEIPDFVVDYVVLHEYLQLKQGLYSFGKGEHVDAALIERKFPKMIEAESWIYKMGIHL